MLEGDFPVPETRVLAIASHVVYGHVGNTMATYVMQALGCEVAALNTVQFSNHLGYRQSKGTRFSGEHITELYEGMKQSYLTDFDALLSGYAPSKEAVEAVGAIGRDLKGKAKEKPGSFFWVLDPVMGDQGRLYVNENVVPAFKEIVGHADLILPNQFEAETLSGIPISSPSDLSHAISQLHNLYKIPHIIITSVRLPSLTPMTSKYLTVIGSSVTSTGQPRLFKILVPDLKCFFSGTGDLFAALMLVRLREASLNADLLSHSSWIPPDTTPATSLPLAHAAEKVLASMQQILEKTMKSRTAELAPYKFEVDHAGEYNKFEKDEESQRQYLAETKAAEVRLVRNIGDLWRPDVRFKAEEFET